MALMPLNYYIMAPLHALKHIPYILVLMRTMETAMATMTQHQRQQQRHSRPQYDLNALIK